MHLFWHLQNAAAKQAARLLKLDYKALLYKMKKLGIDDRMAAMPRPGGSLTAAAKA